MNKVAFLTTVFPMPDEFVVDFFESLDKQTYKGFDIIVVNDNYPGLKNIKSMYEELNILELTCSRTPAKNREYGINYCLKQGYDILIFGDSDDYFAKNRVEKSLELLKENDIVVNDLNLFDENGVYEQQYISHRVANNAIIDLDFIKNKNIFGLSNTALKLDQVSPVSFSEELIAVDWYFFSVLLHKGLKAVFTNETETYYRQYASNTVGIGARDDKSMKKGKKIKKMHYQMMMRIDNTYRLLLHRLGQKREMSVGKPLWWEEIQ